MIRGFQVTSDIVTYGICYDVDADMFWGVAFPRFMAARGLPQVPDAPPPEAPGERRERERRAARQAHRPRPPNSRGTVDALQHYRNDRKVRARNAVIDRCRLSHQ